MADGQNIATIEERKGEVAERYDQEALTFAQRVALDPSIDVERLSRIIDMERDSDRYKAERAFAKAMAEMQPKLPAIEKIGDNSHLKSKYAKLEDIQSAIKPLLSEHGFSVRWTSETIDSKIHVTCVVTHKDGHSERDTLPLPVMTDNKGVNVLQQHGITMSYGKRYTLCNVLGIQLGGDDQDGIMALSGSVLTEQQASHITKLLGELGRDEDVFLQWAATKGYTATEISGLPFESYDQLEKQIRHWLTKVEKSNA
jgi:hypothetical protein